ncbi:hypothetical protein ACNS7O_03200 [Haloferacaceae archaeon DSL9]
MDRNIISIAIIALLILAAGFGGAQSGSFELRPTDGIDTPTRTISYEGASYTMNQTAIAQDGEPVELAVDADDDAEYYVEIFDSNLQYVDDAEPRDDGSVAFETEGLGSGMYLALLYDPETEAYYEPVPIVLPRYEIAVTDVTQDEASALDLTAQVSPADDSPEDVSITVWDDETTERYQFEEVENGTYEATIPLSAFDDGTYSVFVGAFGEDELYDGVPELLGASGNGVLEIDGSETTLEIADAEWSAVDEPTDDSETIAPNDDNESAPSDSDSVPLSPILVVIAFGCVALLARRRS